MLIKDHGKTAIIWKKDIISFKLLLENIEYYSTLFDGGGNRIAIFSENRPEWFYAFYSILKNNSTVLPIDHMSKKDEVSYFLNDCKPEIIFYSKSTENVLKDALQDISHNIKLLHIDDIDLEKSNGQTCVFPEFDSKTTAVIIYSSGTTGKPKGVMTSFENLLVNIEAVSMDVPVFSCNDTVLVMLPLHHIFPLLGTMLAPFFIGSTVAITPSLEPNDILNTLSENKVTVIIGVPRFYTRLMNGIKEKINQSTIAKALYKFSKSINSRSFSKKLFKTVHQKFGGNIKYLVCGGAAIDKGIEEDYRILGFDMLCGFGMTESASIITFRRPGQIKPGSVGKNLKSNEVRITEDGEVITRGKNVMLGYFNRPQETSNTIINGWLHTGDIGYFDKDGFLYLTGRKKEIIILPSGKNINPVNIEFNILKLTDCINEIGIFLHNGILNAVVSPNFEKCSENGITDFYSFLRTKIIYKYNSSVAPYKKIFKITVTEEELPKTRLLKLKRFKLKDMITDQISKQEPVKEPEYKEYSVIVKYLQKLIGRKILSTDHFEYDLTMDSLDKISFQLFIRNTFGIETIDLTKYKSVYEFTQFIHENSIDITIDSGNISNLIHEDIKVQLTESGFIHRILHKSFRLFFSLYFKLKISGKENIPDSPFILASNHQSFLDGFLVGSVLNNLQFQRTYFYAKEKHVNSKWKKYLASINNVIVVNIDKDLTFSIQMLAHVLKAGKNIIIFPEGTRTTNGEIGYFKKTFSILASELNLPVVPVLIDGAFDAFPKGNIIPKPGAKISVSFLKPVLIKNGTSKKVSDVARNSIKKELQKNL